MIIRVSARIFRNDPRTILSTGVHNLHGMPGVFAAIASAFAAVAANDHLYGEFASPLVALPLLQ